MINSMEQDIIARACIPEVKTENTGVNDEFIFRLQIVIFHEANNQGAARENKDSP